MSLDHASLVDELRRAHGAHTIILYGSHARGDATLESDIDVAVFAEVNRTFRDARSWQGQYLDGFVHPTSALHAPADVESLKLMGGIVLLDDRGLGSSLIERVKAFAARGPEPIPEDDRTMRRAWAHKSLARARRGDVEAHYRHHWLLFQILEDAFAFEGRWYLGPKTALADLRSRDPELHALFERALAPGGSLDALEALVRRVAGEP